MPVRKISFPDAAAALELAEAGYDRQRIENITGVDRVTVGDIIRRKGHWLQDVQKPVFDEWRRRTKREIMGRSGEIAVKLLAHAEKNLDKTSPYQAIGMYGILRTHDRLDAGESTSNVEIRSTVELVGLDKLAERLGQRLLPEGQPEK